MHAKQLKSIHELEQYRSQKRKSFYKKFRQEIHLLIFEEFEKSALKSLEDFVKIYETHCTFRSDESWDQDDFRSHLLEVLKNNEARHVLEKIKQQPWPDLSLLEIETVAEWCFEVLVFGKQS